jgi:hypothetical protein
VLQQQDVPLRPVELRLADLSSCSLQEGTHFYLCSTAFGAGICRWDAAWKQLFENIHACGWCLLCIFHCVIILAQMVELVQQPCKAHACDS